MDGSRNINNKAIESPIAPLASEKVSNNGDIKALDNIEKKLYLEKSVVEQKSLSERSVSNSTFSSEGSFNNSVRVSNKDVSINEHRIMNKDSWSSDGSCDEDSSLVRDDASKDGDSWSSGSESIGKDSGITTGSDVSSENEAINMYADADGGIKSKVSDNCKNAIGYYKVRDNDSRLVELHKMLGEGNNGEVYEGVAINSDGLEREVAIKVAKGATGVFGNKKEKQMMAEIDSSVVMKEVPKTGISDDIVIKSKQLILDMETEEMREPSSSDAKDDPFEIVDFLDEKDSQHIVVMEKMASDFDKKMAVYVPEKKEQVFDDVLNGLSILHEKGIAHCDIKPENIFLDELGNAKVGDLGSAVKPFESKKSVYEFMKRKGRENEVNVTNVGDIKGTVIYMSPAALRNYHIRYTLQNEKLSPELTKKTMKEGYNAYELDSWGAGLTIIESYSKTMSKSVVSRLNTCVSLKLEEVRAQGSGNSKKAAEIKKSYEGKLNEMIQEIPVTEHRELASGLIQKDWTVKQALDHLRKHGLNAKKE